MASSPDFVEYVCFQLRHAGEISFKKMFGEYGLYCDRKYFGLVCDNQLFVKVTVPGLEMLPEQEQRKAKGRKIAEADLKSLTQAVDKFTESDNEATQTVASSLKKSLSALATPTSDEK